MLTNEKENFKRLRRDENENIVRKYGGYKSHFFFLEKRKVCVGKYVEGVQKKRKKEYCEICVLVRLGRAVTDGMKIFSAE